MFDFKALCVPAEENPLNLAQDETERFNFNAEPVDAAPARSSADVRQEDEKATPVSEPVCDAWK